MNEPEATAIERIQNNGNHPDEWLEFLTQCQANTPEMCRHLVYLYGRAVNLISAEENRKNISYAKLLVNFAQLQMRISEDEARSTFQLARNNAKHFALVYVAWAQFELSTGNKDKCRSLLRKGKDFGAQPLELLRRAFDNLIEGKKDLLEKSKSSESSAESSPFSTGEESSSGVTDTGISTAVDNTSDVISFKLPSNLNNTRQQLNCIRSNSSSSDETDTLPHVHTSASHPYYSKQCSMSTQKPLIKSTPDIRSGAKSLAGCMNLSVRRKKTRRVLEGTGGAFGLPMRVKVAVPEVEETGNELEGINELEPTVHDSIVRHGNEKIASVGHDDRPANYNKQAHNVSETNAPKDELQEVVNESKSAQKTVNKIFRDENPSDGKRENTSNSSVHIPEQNRENCRQTVTSCTVQQQHSQTNTSGVSFSGLTSQQTGYSGQLNVCSGHVSAGGVVPGYPPRNQFVMPSTVVSQAPQETLVVNGHVYLKLETIGRGGSSKVFRAFDGKRICAIKYVNLEEADDVIVQSYVNEISLLKRLQGNDNIIKLFEWELNLETNTIVIVMECGSIDLAGFLRKHRIKISQGELQGYWRQMLDAVHVTHEQGIIHSDLKPANFLLVEGRLKLIDFGIANTLQGDKTSIERETQVGTLNFMSPEAFQDISHAPHVDSAGNPKPKMKIGRPSDVWSLGCILYMMVYGKTPFQHITNHIAKLQCIIDPSHAIDFPDVKNRHLLDVIKGCLRRAPRERYTIPQLLEHPFLTSPSLDEDKLFDCLMEFAKVDVNSPRSIRAVSKSLCEQLLSGGKIQIEPNVPRPLQVVHSQNPVPPVQDPGRPGHLPLIGIDAQGALKPPIGSGSAKYMKRRVIQQNKENSHLDTVLST